MPEESVDEFLNKAIAERKPLSEEEKKEAMEVARAVWKKAMEYAESPASSSRGLEDENSHTSIFIYKNPQPHEFKFKFRELFDPNADLAISLIRTVRDPNTLRTSAAEFCDSELYVFSPEKVKKLEEHNVPLRVDQYVQTGDRIQAVPIESKDANKKREQTTEEIYHPTKQDLQGLLSKISSSKTTAFLIKNSPWPA